MKDFHSGFMYWISVMSLGVAMVSLNYLVGGRLFSERSKMSPFECGFDAMESAHSPFSFQFFLLAVLFLAFDMEVVLLLLYMWGESSVSGFAICKLLVFVGILLMGLIHELNEGSLSWVKV